MSEQHLPIHDALVDILSALNTYDELVIEAPPGAGKTTVVPLTLLGAEWLGERKILLLEPRRLATRAAASRMAELLDEPIGQTVGYRMRFDTRVSANTRIEVVTEGVLTRMLLTDPSLADVGAVLFDEFHERSLDADAGLALALETRNLFRNADPLKLIVMSATLDAPELARYLGDAPVVRSEGRRFPVMTVYRGDSASGRRTPPSRRSNIIDHSIKVALEALADNPDSSILVFLPGQGEINRVDNGLSGQVPPDTKVMPLYGNLSQTEQQAAIEPCAPGTRKVVLATNIAETSLTIEGVDVVVDSGLVREAVFDPATGMDRLVTRNVSQASAAQREGRAGRLRPGRCYRLWNRDQQEKFAKHSTPELLQADLAPLALTLLDWGIKDPAELKWLDAPPQGPWNQALDLLENLDAMTRDKGGARLTDHGKQLAALPAHPRIGQLLLTGAHFGETETAAAIAAFCAERDPVTGGADIRERIDIILGRTQPTDRLRGWTRRMRQLAGQFSRGIPRNLTKEASLPTEDVAGVLLAVAWPDRLARRRHSRGYQLANGRSAVLGERDRLGNMQWLAVSDVSGGDKSRHDTIRTAAPVRAEMFETHLTHLLHESAVAEWDKKAGRFKAESRRQIGKLVIERKELKELPAGTREAALIRQIRSGSLRLIGWSDEHANWCARVELVRSAIEVDWPDCSEAGLLAALEIWLAPYLTHVSHMNHLKKLDLMSILKSRLDWSKQQTLDKLTPARLRIPSGSHISIDYAQNPPVLAAKLQELFGVETTPSIVGGKVPVLIHLLSPAGRTLQITQDLAHFWRNGYTEVRKEMQGRYPKHPWPEDPLTATATRYTKPRVKGPQTR